jgi:hypothetical protein
MSPCGSIEANAAVWPMSGGSLWRAGPAVFGRAGFAFAAQPNLVTETIGAAARGIFAMVMSIPPLELRAPALPKTIPLVELITAMELSLQ